MRVEHKILWLVFAVMLLVTGAIYFFLHKLELRVLQPRLHTVAFGELKVGIPASFEPGTPKDKSGWHVVVYRSRSVGSFQLATAPATESDFQSAACRYFSMKQFPENTAIYRAGGRFWFAKNLSDKIPGILVIRTRGKGRVFTYFFSYADTSYWLSFTTSHSLRAYSALFFQVVSSLKVNGRRLHDAAFQSKLSSVCREGFFIFCQPILFLLMLPLSIVLLAMWLSSLVSKRLGRLPDLEKLNQLQPFYTEENVSVFLKVRGKNQISRLALVANSTGILLFQFRKLFIELPRKEMNRWELSEGRGWFGGPYLQVKAPAEELIKSKQLFVRFAGMMTVRIYTEHPEMLRQYLL